MLKICHIKSIDDLAVCKEAGVDYVGIHIIDNKHLGLKHVLIKTANLLGLKPVVITKQNSASNIKAMTMLNPNAIQVHTPLIIDEYMSLCNNSTVPIWPVCTYDNIRDYLPIIERSLFTIIDTSYVGGTGLQPQRDDQLNIIPQKYISKIILAGGVNPERIKLLKQSGFSHFDCQSYAKSNGNVSANKVKSLIDSLK